MNSKQYILLQLLKNSHYTKEEIQKPHKGEVINKHETIMIEPIAFKPIKYEEEKVDAVRRRYRNKLG